MNALRWAARILTLPVLLFVWVLPIPDIKPIFPEPPLRVVTLDIPQTVQTTDPRVCVHTRLTDEVEEWKIQETLRMVRQMGAPTIVDFFPWAYVEREPGVYDWTHPDRIIKHAENQGITVIARLGLVPPWVNEDAGNDVATLNLLPHEHFDTFAQFVAAFVSRYQGRVNHIIIWNEPNLSFEWGNRPPDPQAYTALLAVSYAAAKSANPDVVVMGGALAPTLAPAGGMDGAWDDLDFLEQLYEAGAGAYFDALSVHNYPFGVSPLAEPAPGSLNFRRLELMRDVMTRYGDGEKPVFITETGWNDHPRFRDAVSVSERIAFTLEMYRYSAVNYPYVASICLWQFRLPAPTNSYPDYYTLVSSEFESRPLYTALQDYTRNNN